GGRDLLRISKPGEGNYPNLGGQAVQAFPDFPLRAWETDWSLVSSQPAEVTLEGTCPNGLKMSRRIWLEGEWVRTAVTARNGAATGLDVVLQARADLEPGDIDSARVRFRTAAGAAVDRLVLTTGEQPNGSETRRGEDVPAGAWTLERPGLTPVM